MTGIADTRVALDSDDEEVRRAALAGLDPAPGEDDAALTLLIHALGDRSWRVRKEGAGRAARWNDRRAAASALVDALGEPDNVGRRNAAIEALEGLGSVAVAPLCAALAHKPEHRKVLIDTLGLLGDPGGATAVEQSLGDPDPNVRMAAAEALGRIGGAKAQAALRQLAKNALAGPPGDLVLVVAAIDGLVRTGARLPFEEIAPLVEKPSLKPVALAALSQSGDPRALPLLVAALTEPGRSTVEAGLRGLGELLLRLGDGAPPLSLPVAAEQAVVRALVDQRATARSEVRHAAVEVLGRARSARLARPLLLALGDPAIHDAAEQALSRLAAADTNVAAELMALSPELEPALRAALFELLPRLVRPADRAAALALLEEAIGDEDSDVAAAAAAALGAIGDATALAPLMRGIERRDDAAIAAAVALGHLGERHYDEVRVLVMSRGLEAREAPQLVRALGLCGREADVHWLRGALGAAASEVRRAAAEALATLVAARTVEVDEALAFALTDEASEVRAAAARALGAHVSAASLAALERAAADVDAAVRTAAARAIAEIAAVDGPSGEQAALAVLRRLADGAEVVVAVPAIEALGALVDPNDDARLLRALRGEDAEVVKASARALGARAATPSAEQAREALARTLSDGRWDVRRAAAQALGRHGPAAHALLYARRSVETDSLVLEALDEALGRSLGDDSRGRRT
jgi:HEAT repeat protein